MYEILNSILFLGLLEWPLSETRELVLNGYNLSVVGGIEVYVDVCKINSIKVTNDHIVLTPPTYSNLQKCRENVARSSSKRKRETASETDYEGSPDKRSRPKKYDSDHVASVTVRLGHWNHEAGKLYYTKMKASGVPYVAIIIPIVGFIVLVVLLTYVGMR